jgi:DNA-directed RNA polymerase specialized sigma24 family protein
VNNALGRLRRRSRRKETEMESHLPRFDPEGYLIWPTTQVVEPVDRLLESELVARQVREAIHELPGDYRDVLLLRSLQGTARKRLPTSWVFRRVLRKPDSTAHGRP